MSMGAMIMMIVGCGGLWGGCAAACFISIKHSKKRKAEEEK